MGLYVLLCLSFPCVPYVASFSGVSTFSYPFGNVALTFIQFVFTSICFVRSDILFDVICIYLCILVFGRCPYHMMSLTFNSHTTGTTSRAERFTLEEHLNSSLFCGSRFAQFYVLFCGT
jgi:hypothetical protein